jgi:hypothetical protein
LKVNFLEGCDLTINASALVIRQPWKHVTLSGPIVWFDFRW